MFKFNLGVPTNLPKLFLLGFSNLFFLPIINIPLASGQSVSNTLNYFCQSHQSSFATFGRTSPREAGQIIIIWDNRRSLCDTVSRRFQAARDNGNLRFLVREGSRVCGTNMRGGDCRSLLFITSSVASADGAIGNFLSDNPIRDDYITQSDRRSYFNLELYLENLEARPASPNQVSLENK